MAWWKCENGHTWYATIKSRINCKNEKAKCPKCNSLAYRFSKIAKEWHKSLNGSLKPINTSANSKIKAYWQCPKNPEHVWQARISSRTGLKSGCPLCAADKRKSPSFTN